MGQNLKIPTFVIFVIVYSTCTTSDIIFLKIVSLSICSVFCISLTTHCYGQWDRPSWIASATGRVKRSALQEFGEAHWASVSNPEASTLGLQNIRVGRALGLGWQPT